MSDNKTVPSAEAIFEKYRIRLSLAYEAGGMGVIKHWDYLMTEENFILASNEHTRLHLEAMLSEITSGDEKVLLKRDIEKTGNNYISKIK